MAANVLFKLLTEAQWDALTTKDNGTLYRVQKTGGGEDFYQGSSKLNNAAEISAAIAALDTASDVAIATQSGNAVTIAAGISETDGIIGAGSGTAITLADVAATGAAEDVSIADSGSYFTSTDVEGALAELAQASAGGVASKTIWVEDESAGQSDYAKVYKIYQCATQAEEAAGTLKGTINIPKDLFIKSASVETVTVEDEPYEGAHVGDKYIDIEVQNQTDHIYVPCNSLVDEYTAEQSASQIQLAIDANNVISATVVAGSIDTTELAAGAVTTAKIDDDAVTTAKIADDAVTADKVAISAHSETQTAGADGLALSVTTTDGQVSAVSGSIAANTYDSYGAAAAVDASLAAVAKSGAASDVAYTNTTSGLTATTVQGAIDEVAGTAGSIDGKIAAAIEALDATETQTAGADGLALSITEVDGVITSISGSIASGVYDVSGSAQTAENNAKYYADGLLTWQTVS